MTGYLRLGDGVGRQKTSALLSVLEHLHSGIQNLVPPADIFILIDKASPEGVCFFIKVDGKDLALFYNTPVEDGAHPYISKEKGGQKLDPTMFVQSLIKAEVA